MNYLHLEDLRSKFSTSSWEESLRMIFRQQIIKKYLEVKNFDLKIDGGVYGRRYLKDRLYMIRGKRVLLDADLAIIYGYTTKAFNQQVKNNIEKFDEDFMFELSDEEVENLRSKFLTANISSKSRYIQKNERLHIREP